MGYGWTEISTISVHPFIIKLSVYETKLIGGDKTSEIASS